MSAEPPLEPGFLLPAPLTLQLQLGGAVVFSSEQHWLHPLFELETFLARGCDLTDALLVDRVTGRAAAFLVARLGIRRLHTGVLSRLAIPILDHQGIEYRCAEKIERLSCATETLLSGIHDPEQAYALLKERRERTLSR